MGDGGRVRAEAISKKGCSKLFLGMKSSFPSFRRLQTVEPMYPVSSSPSAISESAIQRTGPFSGLVICVTGLSKEARKQVMDATEKLGGQYSPHLHPQCTHLVVQSYSGRKFEHAVKHGSKNGLVVVPLGWFVDSVRRNVRLSESLYNMKNNGENVMPMEGLNRFVQAAGSENSCLPVNFLDNAKNTAMSEGPDRLFEKESQRSLGLILYGSTLYVDVDVSAELRNKVVEVAAGEGATLVDEWIVGCNASHVACEGPSVHKYIGHACNVVTPLWVLKTAKEKRLQRLVHLSADLARQVGVMLDNVQNGVSPEASRRTIGHTSSFRNNESHEQRQKIVDLAKSGVRKRRGRHMQTCQAPIRPITPSSLLDSICWTISEPTSTAAIYTDFSSAEHNTSAFFDAKGDRKELESSFQNFSRLLSESEKSELIFTNHFLTIMFPVDRFSEMGPCSRTFFSNPGFTCLQVLDHIYAFYQEKMSAQEIELAIHTDSRHADRLRAVYAGKQMVELDHMEFKRIDFLGSRRSFEMLKRVSGDNNGGNNELPLSLKFIKHENGSRIKRTLLISLLISFQFYHTIIWYC